jgi:hypothetical protein
MTEDEQIEADANKMVTVSLTRGELSELLEAIDSYVYWQLSDEHYRNNGFVNEPSSDDPDTRKQVEQAWDLHKKLEDVFFSSATKMPETP